MAKMAIVNMTDDMDGTGADETVTFSLDGSNYEIDLGSENAAKMRSALTVWADAARPAQEPGMQGKANGQPLYPGRVEAQAIRA